RTIIQRRRRCGLPPRPHPLEFAQTVLHEDIEKYRRSASDSGYVFFDRSVLDALCMLDQVTPLQQSELEAHVSTYPYHRRVFFFPPWEAIYTNDTERDQTFAEAARVYRRLVEWYCRCAYEVIEVPTVTVPKRCEYVLQVLGRDA